MLTIMMITSQRNDKILKILYLLKFNLSKSNFNFVENNNVLTKSVRFGCWLARKMQSFLVFVSVCASTCMLVLFVRSLGLHSMLWAALYWHCFCLITVVFAVSGRHVLCVASTSCDEMRQLPDLWSSQCLAVRSWYSAMLMVLENRRNHVLIVFADLEKYCFRP